MLPLDREIIYRICAEAYEQSSGNQDTYEHLVRSDIRVRGLSPWMIAIIVRLALMLFAWWLASGTHRPTLVKDPQFPANFETAFGQLTQGEPSDD
jgi:hypothetical protein